MNKKLRTSAVSHLFEAILTLETEEECYAFFEDLCTVNELLSISQRFEVACMLRRHETYLQIAAKTLITEMTDTVLCSAVCSPCGKKTAKRRIDLGES